MNPDIHLAPAYRVIRLMDLNIPHPEIAARTGFDEDYVSGIESWSRENAEFPGSSLAANSPPQRHSYSGTSFN